MINLSGFPLLRLSAQSKISSNFVPVGPITGPTGVALIFFLFLLPRLAAGQGIEKFFFSKSGDPVDSAESIYYTIGKFNPVEDNRTDTIFTYYSSTGHRRSFDIYNHKDRTQGGNYHENGVLSESGSYIKGGRSGEWTRWYPNGKIQRQVTHSGGRDQFSFVSYFDSLGVELISKGNGVCRCYDTFIDAFDRDNFREDGRVEDGKREGDWNGYVSQVLTFTENYEHGELKSGMRLGAQGKIYYKTIEEQPEYTGGFQALSGYLSRSIRYPGVARRKGIEGKVFVGFIIEKNGSVSNVKTVLKVHTSLDG